MSILSQIPDIEKLVGSYLRDDDNIQALNARVGGQLPKTFTNPWVRLTLLDATNATNSEVERLISYLVQADCYAGSDPQVGQAQASQLGITVRAILISAQKQTLDGAVITAVEIRSHARLPDLDFDPPRERVTITAEIWAHGV